MSAGTSGLGGASVSAMKWEALLTVARYGLQLGAQILLARMLGPDIYGVFGMALVVMTFAGFVTEFGFSMNLVQRADLTDEDIRLVNTWQWIQGLVVAGGLFWLAPEVAGYFGEPRVEPVVRWLAVVGFLNAVAGTPSALMARAMNFRARGMVDVAGYAVGYVGVALPMAWMGFGVEALVAAWLVQAAVKWLGLCWMQRFPQRFLLWSPRARALMQVGVTAFFTNVVNWTLTNVDRVLIGRLMNAHAVGVYTASYNLANTPNSLLIGSLQGVLLSATARLQNERERMQGVYVQVVAAVLVCLAPAFGVASMLGPEVIRVLYGDRWDGAGPVLGILLAGMPFYVLWGVSTPVLWNTGRRHWEAMLQLPVLVIAVLLLFFAAQKGLLWMACVASGVFVGRALVVSAAAAHRVGVPARRALGLVARALGLWGGLAAWLWPALGAMRAQGWPAGGVLVAAVLWTLALVALGWRWRTSIMGADAMAVLERVLARRRRSVA